MENELEDKVIELDRQLTDAAYEKLSEGQLSRDAFAEVTVQLRRWSEIGYDIVGKLDSRTQRRLTTPSMP